MPPLKHLVSVDQLTDEVLRLLFKRADELREVNPRELVNLHRGKFMASIFFGESTRTRISFEIAAQRLGIGVSSTVNAERVSSVAKGENTVRMMRTVQEYADIVVIRHSRKGEVAKAASVSRIPVINGADGLGDHPTQALLDTHHIMRTIGRLDGLNVVFAGDCKRSRTIHPLAKILARGKARITFVSRPTLRAPEWLVHALTDLGAEFREVEHFNRKILAQADVVYMTRDQHNLVQTNNCERETHEDYLTGTPVILTAELMDHMTGKSCVLHPGPFISEITPDAEVHPRFQAYGAMQTGMWDRMALIDLLLMSKDD